MTTSRDSQVPLVVVAIGGQEISVITELDESDRPYRIRAFTRDPTKPVGKKRAQQSVNVVEYDPQMMRMKTPESSSRLRRMFS